MAYFTQTRERTHLEWKEGERYATSSLNRKESLRWSKIQSFYHHDGETMRLRSKKRTVNSLCHCSHNCINTFHSPSNVIEASILFSRFSKGEEKRFLFFFFFKKQMNKLNPGNFYIAKILFANIFRFIHQSFVCGRARTFSLNSNFVDVCKT